MGPWIVGRNRGKRDIGKVIKCGWFGPAGTGGTGRWKEHGSFCSSLDT